ncbi:flippase [Latilactobacillus sakei]|uniref:flippase n=1 Tax=Latilactobacillus sakei TaxID=1599 RepID=UPI0024DF4AFC|nr:flippase [Latilactobacillus sakei]
MKIRSLKISAFFNMLRTLLNIAFPLITFPYITRILSPDGIGKLDFSRSIISYFVLLAALGITQYAVREGSAIRDNVIIFNKFVNEIFTLNLLTALISYLLLIILLFSTSYLKQYSTLILIFSLQIIFNTLSVEWLYNIYEDFIYITIRSFIVQVVSIIGMFLFVKSKNDYIIYAWITTISMGGAYIFNFIHASKFINFKLEFSSRIFRHLQSTLILFFNNVASTIYLNSDVTIIGFMVGDYYVGIYSTAVKVYTIVKQVTNALLMSTLPRLSNYYNNQRVEEYLILLDNIFWAMFTLLAPSITGLIILRKAIVNIIAGNQYSQSTSSLYILSFGLLFSVLAAFIVHGILLVQREEKSILKITLISAIVNVVLNLITVPIFKEKGAAVSTVTSECIVVILGLMKARGKFSINFYLNKFLAIIIGCSAITMTCITINIFVANTILSVSLSVLLSAVIYGIILILFRAVPKL